MLEPKQILVFSYMVKMENLNLNSKAEATAAELEGSLGVNVLGGEVGVSGSVSVGVGAHADVGYKDGVFKFDIGASIGLGVSVGSEVDIGGMVMLPSLHGMD